MFLFWMVSLFFIASVSTFSPVHKSEEEIFMPYEDSSLNDLYLITSLNKRPKHLINILSLPNQQTNKLQLSPKHLKFLCNKFLKNNSKEYERLLFLSKNINLCRKEEKFMTKILGNEKRSSSSYDFVRFGRRNSFQMDGKPNKKSNGNNGNTYDYIRFG
uniref:Uncharacterized protein n=2 Tax=Meloidogyne TaxID=189290 RepID=A0A6V7WKP8_MELEN|nr:unnamed protein product [Meloidogyne enterolobii]